MAALCQGEEHLMRVQVQSMGLATSAQCAECEVTTRWMGFVRIWQGSGEAFDMVDLFLPDVQITTQVDTLLHVPFWRSAVQ